MLKAQYLFKNSIPIKQFQFFVEPPSLNELKLRLKKGFDSKKERIEKDFKG